MTVVIKVLVSLALVLFILKQGMYTPAEEARDEAEQKKKEGK